MRVSFFTKLRLALLCPALATLILAGLLVSWLLPARYESSAAMELIQTAELLAPAIAEHVGHGGVPLQAWVRDLAGHSDLRVTVVREDGVVIADSARTDAQLVQMENHRDRPEIRAARATGTGSSVRKSATTGRSYAYAARAVRPPAGPPLVVRVAQPLHALDLVERQLARAALLAGLAALLVTFLISWWLGRRLFRPLAQVVADADRLVAGAPGGRLSLPADPELATLVAALNRLAERVQEQVTAAERERDHLRSILASMAEGVLVTDASGRALLANPAFVRLFGATGDVRGKVPIEVARVPQLQELVRRALAGDAPTAQEVLLERGERRHAALAATQLGDGGAVVVARDVTPFVRLNEVRRDFVANVSHELKTPLAAIRGLAETLRDGALSDPEASGRFLARILEQCGRLESLLRDLLTLSRLESPGGAKELELVDLAGLARHAGELMAPGAAERGVHLEVETGPAMLHGDGDALERLLINLLDNAVKYNRSGGAVRLAVRAADGQLVIEVRDTGIGIASPHLQRLFERFYRVDRGRSRDEGGTGLGLAIVKHVAQLHGGRVEVESQPGVGSTFTVVLPVDSRAGATGAAERLTG